MPGARLFGGPTGPGRQRVGRGAGSPCRSCCASAPCTGSCNRTSKLARPLLPLLLHPACNFGVCMHCHSGRENATENARPRVTSAPARGLGLAPKAGHHGGRAAERGGRRTNVARCRHLHSVKMVSDVTEWVGAFVRPMGAEAAGAALLASSSATRGCSSALVRWGSALHCQTIGLRRRLCGQRRSIVHCCCRSAAGCSCWQACNGCTATGVSARQR
jgi:hypothetical protein